MFRLLSTQEIFKLEIILTVFARHLIDDLLYADSCIHLRFITVINKSAQYLFSLLILI